jgi:hydrogenase nickel incorporation protein HypB
MTNDKGKKAEIAVGGKNAAIAAANRRLFDDNGLYCLNLIGSPGCGKTSLLEATAKHFGSRMAVIEGDVRTAFDAERIKAAGVAAVQIETGGSCHLDARQVAKAAGELDLSAAEILFIENVGNLVCPSGVYLGEHAKTAVISVPEGDEKPAKYPSLFVRADVVVINKIDLVDYTDYSIERASADCKKLNSNVRIMPLSCRTGEGLDAWFKYLEEPAGSA